MISAHESNERSRSLRMTRWLNEVQTSVDTVVNNFLTVDPVLIFQILVESRLDVFNDWSPTEDVSKDS